MKQRLTPLELKEEILHRIAERLSISGYTDHKTTPPTVYGSARNEAIMWARDHYPETFKRIAVDDTW